MSRHEKSYRKTIQIIFLLISLSGLVACGGSGDDDDDCPPWIFPFCLLNELVPDEIPSAGPAVPSPPDANNARAVSTDRIMVYWHDFNSTDRAGFQLYRDGVEHRVIDATDWWDTWFEFEDDSLEPATRYCYRVATIVQNSAETAASEEICATTLDDETAPSIPEEVEARSISTTVSEIDLSWNEAFDLHAVAGYRIFRDGLQIGDTGELRFRDSGLEANRQYCYTVRAYDEWFNESGFSIPVCATTSWMITQLEFGISNPAVAIALDEVDRVHFAYAGEIGGSLQTAYTRYEGGSWSGVNLGTQPYNYGQLSTGVPSIKTDRTGAVYVGTRGKYSTNISGEWESEVNPELDFSKLELDSWGNMHLLNIDPHSLYYSTNLGGGWISEKLGDAWSGGVVALAPDNSVHIAYFQPNTRELRYATNASGVWTDEIIERIDNSIYQISIDIDSSGSIHLSYYAYGNSDLKYATNVGGQWSVFTLDSDGDVGTRSAIFLDQYGYVHISYFNKTRRELRYINNVSGSWQVGVIDEVNLLWDSIWTDSTAIAVDSLGKVHIAYHDDQKVYYVSNR